VPGFQGSAAFELVAKGSCPFGLSELALGNRSLLDCLRYPAYPLSADSLLGKSTLNVGTISGGARPTSLPTTPSEIMFR